MPSRFDEFTEKDKEEIDRHIRECHGDGERDDCTVCDDDRFLETLADFLSTVGQKRHQVSYIVEMEPGVWLAPWKGDPGRTCVEASATRYATRGEAESALDAAKVKYPRRGYRSTLIHEVKE